MKNKTVAIAIITVLLAVMCATVVVSDDNSSDGATTYSARVFTDVSGTTVEYAGTGSTVKDVVVSGMSTEHQIEIYANGSVKSVDGVEATSGHAWVVFQWVPLKGWTIVMLNSSADSDLDSGTSYYVTLSTVTAVGNKTMYSAPSYEPTSKAYFYIKMIDDSNSSSVISILTEDERKAGFWISGTGSDAAEAFHNACATYGLELNMNLTEGNEMKGWLGSFMGLEDVQISSSEWKYWSQFHWDGNSWVFSECLGHYDPGVVKYYGFVRQITVQDNPSSRIDITPGSIPTGSINNGCTVKFIDGDGNTIKTQNVSYFRSATAPSTATKTSQNGNQYIFTGWDRTFDHIISDTTVTATFSSIGGSEGGDEPDTINVSGVKIAGNIQTVTVGNTISFISTITPNDASNTSVSWSSSDEGILTVDASGKAKGISAGTATVTVKTADGGFTDSVSVEVVEPVSVLKLDVEGGLLHVGDTLSLKVASTSAGNVDWISDNEKVLSVSSGVITAKSVGTATIRVTLGSLSESATFFVTDASKDAEVSIDLNKDSNEASIIVSAESIKKLTDTRSSLKMTTGLGSLLLSGSAVETLSKTDGDVLLTIKSVDNEDLTNDQRKSVGDSSVYSLDAMIGTLKIHNFGGDVTVTLPFSSNDASKVIVRYLDSNTGLLTDVPCSYDSNSRMVSFVTGHFSYFVISESSLSNVPDELNEDSNKDSNLLLILGIVATIIIVSIAGVVIARRKIA